MTQVKEKIEPDLVSLERDLSYPPPEKLPQTKSFAPPPQRGIHELIREVREDAAAVLRKLEIIEQRLVEFDRAQAAFYNGRKP
jgi:hypothetical protein